jgi:PAS domain S-box-containing protein
MTDNSTELPSLEELYDRASGGLLLADPDGLIRRVNRTFCDWLGYSATELVGKKKFPKLLTMGGQIFLQTHFIPLLQIQRSVAEVKLDFVHADGSVVPMLINCARRHHAAEEFDQLFAFLAHDRQKYERELLAARRKAEELSEKLASANQKKDEFLAMLAHELRNPLAPMRNVLEILKRKRISSIPKSPGRATFSIDSSAS